MGFLLTTDCHATEPVALTPPSATNARHELTAEDLSSFTEGIIGNELRRFGIPGAVLVAVKDGKVLLSRGYGFADFAAARAAQRASTTIPIVMASINDPVGNGLIASGPDRFPSW